MTAPERMAALVSSNGFPTIKVDAGMTLVGRSPECDVVVESKKISRRHCCLALVNDRLHVRDLGSTNGCWRNGQRDDDFSVEEGQEFAIGDAMYRFRWDHPSDHIMLPGAGRRPVARPNDAPQTVSQNPSSRSSPESSDPFMQLAGLA